MKKLAIDLDVTLKTSNAMYGCAACPWRCPEVEDVPEAAV